MGKDKIPESDRKTINDECDETIAWLDNNQTAETDEYKDKQKEIEGVCNPIVTKLYGQQGQGGGAAGGMPGGMPGGPGGPGGAPGGSGGGNASGQGPTVEEVD